MSAVTESLQREQETILQEEPTTTPPPTQEESGEGQDRLVPVTEAIRYRKRAQAAELQAQIADQPGPIATARLDLAGAWTAFRVGDRVRDALGRGIAIDGHPASFATRDARIQRIDVTLGVSNTSPRTRLRLDEAP